MSIIRWQLTGATLNSLDVYNRKTHPLLIVISGASGVGKDTIAKMMMDRRDQFHFVVTATTRKPRSNEVDGVDYIFVTHDEFAKMIEANELLEYAIVYNDYKGVPKQQIRDALKSGRDVIMRVDVQGAATIRDLVPNAIFIFLATETEEALVERLRQRKSETVEGLKLRIAMAREEMKRVEEFDYCVVNAANQQAETVRRILCIIDAEHQRVDQEPILL
jgi:guanylate kinase